MGLVWLVHEIDGARLLAAFDGFGGSFLEAHPLDAKTAKKIPRKMIGRALTTDEAAALLDSYLERDECTVSGLRPVRR